MSLDRTMWGDLITEVGTTRLYTLGTQREYDHATYKRQIWRYVYNNSGADIAANLGVMQEDGTTPYEISLSDANVEQNRLLGATQHIIASASYGWILSSGEGLFTSDGSTTADTAQQGAANGQFTDGVVGTDELILWAQATENPAGAGGTFQGRIATL